MGFFSDMISGAVTTAARPGIESMFGKLGWSIDARHGDGKYELHFSGGVFGVRRLLILADGDLTTFYLSSSAEINDGNALASIGYLLLMRNKELAMGTWLAREDRNGGVGFSVSYAALSSGLDAAKVGSICTSICEEVNAVDKYMRSKGLI